MKTLINVRRFATAMMMGLLATQTLSASEIMVLDLAKANTKVDFHADGKILKVHGENGKATGELTIKDGSVFGTANVALKDITTGIALRDEHMKDKYLEVNKFPMASLEIIQIKLPAKMAGDFEAPFRGKLTLHGVTQLVSGTAKLSSSGEKLKGTVEFKTLISNHKIELPKYSGIVIKDEVKVKVDFDGVLKKGKSGQAVVKN